MSTDDNIVAHSYVALVDRVLGMRLRDARGTDDFRPVGCVGRLATQLCVSCNANWCSVKRYNLISVAPAAHCTHIQSFAIMRRFAFMGRELLLHGTFCAP